MELSPDASEDVKQEAGRNLLRRLTEMTGISVRSRYTDGFFARGQRHILADEGQMGWHVDYAERIQSLETMQP
jgi:Uri superfamily endonuclease